MNRGQCRWCDRPAVPGRSFCEPHLREPHCALCGDADAGMQRLSDGRIICGGCLKLAPPEDLL